MAMAPSEEDAPRLPALDVELPANSRQVLSNVGKILERKCWIWRTSEIYFPVGDIPRKILP